MSLHRTAFCCFDDVEVGSRYAVWFTAGTAVINLVINIFVLVNVHWFLDHLEPLEEWTWIPPGSLALLYIELVFNLIFLFLAYVLHSGIKENELRNKRYCCLGWGVGTMIARGYEIFLMIYFLVWIGSYRVSDVVFVFPQGLFIVAYWGLDTILLLLALMCVTYYYKAQYYDRRGKIKRVNFFAALRKIRQKAITRIVKHSGTPSFATMGLIPGSRGPSAPASRGPSMGSMSVVGKPRTQSAMSGATYSSIPTHPARGVLPSAGSSVYDPTYDNRGGAPPAGYDNRGPRPTGPPAQRYPPPRDTSTMVPAGQRPPGPIRPVGPMGPRGPMQPRPAAPLQMPSRGAPPPRPPQQPQPMGAPRPRAQPYFPTNK